MDSTEVQIIGLWGMGGIGKTTLAAAMFHKVSFQYEGSCFLENVTEISKMHGINYTCNKLLSKLLREDFDIDTSKVIPSMIIRRLKRMKSLIVLDDVHTLELLQNLIGVGHCWLGAGSTVIVTTRDKHVLISGGIEKFHQVTKMNSQNSLQLFSLNAFDKVLPTEGYVELSERAIDYAKGNPLALKVLGSSLRCKSEIEWNCALAKLKEIPNVEIDRILRWSYNELDDKEKNIFLDIACILKGFKQDSVTKILNECGFFADIGIRDLLDKALIRIDYEKCIQMHDLIQEMGKQIVREESPKNPGQRSRLCDPKEVCDVLKNNKGTELVEAIFFYATEYTNICLSPKAFEKMVNLRLLVFQDHKEIKSVSLPHGLDFLPENLRYFLWERYPLKSLPPNFFPEMFVVLSMQNSNVEKLWSGEMNLPKLDRLDLGDCKKLIECPNVSGSPNLTFLLLDGCESMLEVDSSVFFLQKLQIIKMSNCTSVKSLSSSSCSPVLRELYALECNNLKEFSVTFTSGDNLHLGLTEFCGNELPSSLLNIKNLDSFYFPMIECLVDLPENFANHIYLENSPNDEHDLSITLHKVLSSPAFISLKHLYLENIPTLFEIPDNITLLSSLESLMLIDMAITSLPENIKHLPQLNQLNVCECKKLQSIPALSQFIPFFIVLDCESLEKVLSSMGEACDKPNPCFSVLINCKKLDLHSYQTVLEDAIDGIEHGARLNSANEDDIVGYLLPDMPGREYWFNYRSTQVTFTLELPPNLLGFAYYFVLSQGNWKKGVDFGCECNLEYSSGERIYITSFTRSNSFIYELSYGSKHSIHTKSDHVVLWYDPVSCKKIMEEIKAIKELNNTSYCPKLAFRFFIDEALHDGSTDDKVAIKECGFRWIYKEGADFSTVFESQEEEEEEERIHPRKTSSKLLKYWAYY
ncbi:disease resistance protein RUN1 [Trifolium repens]|nr:disease resistance protein RUN1 [Trifolium repens]